MIKAAFFDIGGVVFTSITEEFHAVIKQAFGLTDDELDKGAMSHLSSLNMRYEMNKINELEFWTLLSEYFQKSLPTNWPSLFSKIFSNQHMRPKLKQLIFQLKSRGILVYALTNVSKEKAESNTEKGYYDIFDGSILSYKLGMGKPHKDIYFYALKVAKTRADQALFIDDLLKNVEGAKAVGMHAVHFTSEEEFFKEISKFDLL